MAAKNKQSIRTFLPEAGEDTILVQANVPTSLHAAVKGQMAIDKETGIPMDWTTLFIAACKAYLAESKASVSQD